MFWSLGGFLVVNASYLCYLDSRRLRLASFGAMGVEHVAVPAGDLCRLSNNDAFAGASGSCELSPPRASRRAVSGFSGCRVGPRGHGILPPRFLRQQPDA